MITKQQKQMIRRSKRFVKKLSKLITVGDTYKGYIECEADINFEIWLQFFDDYPHYNGYLVFIAQEFIEYIETIGIVKPLSEVEHYQQLRNSVERSRIT